MKIALTTNIDDTLIFEKNKFDNYKSNFRVCEDNISSNEKYISENVENKLCDINNIDNVDVIYATSRSTEEFNRLQLKFKPEYIIVDAGGNILKNGKPLEEYDEYIRKNINNTRIADVALSIDCMYSIENDCKFIDNRYLLANIGSAKECEKEVLYLIEKYTDFNFHIHNNKLYAIPQVFSKAVALRWLQHFNKYDKLVTIGSSEFDINTLYISDYAIVPKHSTLIKNGIVQDGIIVDDCVECVLKATDVVENLIKN